MHLIFREKVLYKDVFTIKLGVQSTFRKVWKSPRAKQHWGEILGRQFWSPSMILVQIIEKWPKMMQNG